MSYFLLPFCSFCLLLFKFDRHVNRIYYVYCTKSYFLWFSLLYFDKNLKIRYKKCTCSWRTAYKWGFERYDESLWTLYLAASGVQWSCEYSCVCVCVSSAFIKRVELWVSEQPSKSYQAATSWFSIFEVPVSILGWDTGSLEVVLVFLRVSRKMPGYYTFPLYYSRISL
jgi:hypothetical protein